MGGATAAHHHLPSWNCVRCSPGMATRTYIRVGGQTAAVHQISRKPKRKVLPHQQLFMHHLLQHNSWVFSPQTWNLLRDLIYTLFPTKKIPNSWLFSYMPRNTNGIEDNKKKILNKILFLHFFLKPSSDFSKQLPQHK